MVAVNSVDVEVTSSGVPVKGGEYGRSMQKMQTLKNANAANAATLSVLVARPGGLCGS